MRGVVVHLKMDNQKKINILEGQISKIADSNFNFRTWLPITKNLVKGIFPEDYDVKNHQLEMVLKQPGASILGIQLDKLKDDWSDLLYGYIEEIEMIQIIDPSPTSVILDELFVSEDRINDLRSIKSTQFDFSKLICLCEEINSNFKSKNYMSVSMIGRAIIDHVPPIFGYSNFKEVANNYSGGGTSFKKSMLSLNSSLRNIADMYLHMQIRSKESLPNSIQIKFNNELDLLLAEIKMIQ